VQAELPQHGEVTSARPRTSYVGKRHVLPHSDPLAHEFLEHHPLLKKVPKSASLMTKGFSLNDAFPPSPSPAHLYRRHTQVTSLTHLQFRAFLSQALPMRRKPMGLTKQQYCHPHVFVASASADRASWRNQSSLAITHCL